MSRRLVGACLLLVPFAGAAAGIAPRKASDIVRLVQTGATCPIAGYEPGTLTLPDGQVVDFEIPAKQVPIVTGFDWSATSGTPGAPVIGLLSSQTSQGLVSHAHSSATFASNGSISANQLTPPVVIASGRSICVSVTAGTFNAAALYGYLVPDK